MLLTWFLQICKCRTSNFIYWHPTKDSFSKINKFNSTQAHLYTLLLDRAATTFPAGFKILHWEALGTLLQVITSENSWNSDFSSMFYTWLLENSIHHSPTNHFLCILYLKARKWIVKKFHFIPRSYHCLDDISFQYYHDPHFFQNFNFQDSLQQKFQNEYETRLY